MKKLVHSLVALLRLAILCGLVPFLVMRETLLAQTSIPAPLQKLEFVAEIEMDMPILPGTSEFLQHSITQAHQEGAKILIVHLNTPGGMLHTSQEMIQALLNSPIPVAIYVSPSGSAAISAGVFITLAGHVAAMAPGTSIGAAHPVLGSGKDIEGDMREKVENITIAIVKSIAEHRGRNVAWAEKSVKESSSLTEKEALKNGVVDLIADDVNDLLKQIRGKEVSVTSGKVLLEDYSQLPRRKYDLSLKQRTLNVFADPNILALLWLCATTGLAIELYNPGVILPGVVGAICLILALAVSQVIPVSQGGVLLLVLGVLMIGAELFIPSGVLGVGGIISIVLGAIYLVDVSLAPDLIVNLHFLIPIAMVFGMGMLAMVMLVVKSSRRRVTTGSEGLVGQFGVALERIGDRGRIFVNGETWNAVLTEGVVEKDSPVEVVGMREGLLLEIRAAALQSGS